MNEQNTNNTKRFSLKRFLLRTLLTIGIILGVIALFLAMPFTQNYLAKGVVSWLNKEYNIDIEIEKVHLQINGSVRVKNILVRDHKQDTLLASKRIKTSLTRVGQLIKGNLLFGNLDIDNLIFNLKTHRGDSLSNLDVFIEKFASESPSSGDFLMKSPKITLNDTYFRIIDQNQTEPTVFQIDRLQAKILDFNILNSDISFRLDSGNLLLNKNININQLQTDFVFSQQFVSACNSTIKTNFSEIRGDFDLYLTQEGFSDFGNSVDLHVYLSEALIATEDINLFYDGFGKGKTIYSNNLELRGPLNDFSITQGSIQYQNTTFDGFLRFKNLLDSEKNIEIIGNIQEFSSIYNDLATLMPNLIGSNLPEIIKELGFFSAKGSFNYTTTALETNLQLTSSKGKAHAMMILDGLEDLDKTVYNGKVSVNNLNVGALLKDPTIGTLTTDIEIQGSGFTPKSLFARAKGDVHSFVYNNYRYNNIYFTGDFKNQLFNGIVKAKDSNLDFEFKGLADLSKKESKFDFGVKVKHADLHALNFVQNDSISKFKGNIIIDGQGNSIDNVIGEIQFRDLQYTNSRGNYTLENFEVKSSMDNEGIKKIQINSPDIINGYVTGTYKVAEIKKIFQNAFGSIYAHFKPYKIAKNQFINFDFTVNDKIIEIFAPEVQIGKNTSLQGKIVADDGSFKMQFKSSDIKAYDYKIKNINLKIDNKNPLYNTYLEVGDVDLGVYKINDFNLINTTIKDTLFFRTEFKGGVTNNDSYALSFYHTLTQKQESVIGIKKSEINFRGNNWFINRENDDQRNKIIINRTADSIKINNFKMAHRNQYLSVSGLIASPEYKNLHIVANNISLDKVTPEMEGIDLKGTLNGHMSLIQKEKLFFPSSDLFIKRLRLNGYDYGDLEASVFGNNDLSAFKVQAHLINGKTAGFQLGGNIFLDNQKGTSLDLKTRFIDFNLAPFSPLAKDILYDLRGWVSGGIDIEGYIENPVMEGELSINKGGFGISYLNVNTAAQDNAKIIVKKQTFELDNWLLTDTVHSTQALVSGSVRHNNLSDWFFDLSLDTQNKRFLVLNTPYTDDALFYGTGFINGKASIRGALDELVISVNAITSEGTSFKIPLSDNQSIGDESFINFVEKNRTQVQTERVLQSIKGLELQFDLGIRPTAEVEIILDKKTGSNLVGRGEGTVLMEINTNGKFNLWGDFITYSGYYNFKYENIIDKRFEVLPGGSISWDGDPLKATLRNLRAAYMLNANPAALLESSQYNRKIPTQVVIKLEGELMKPETLFDINFPESNAGLVSELNYRLEDQDRKQLQAFSLLAQGSFMSERNTDNRLLAYNLFETAAGLFNQILSDEDNKLNLGVSYEAGATDSSAEYENSDRLGFSVSTQIDDWISINAKVGIPVGGVTRTAVAGDVEVLLRLTEDGSLTAKVFNRENEWQQYVVDDVVYTQGVGISYNVDFNTFKELIHKIFGKGGKIIEKQ
ncbi:translocation/assembly module TamB domain-containing protein [Capnocytophaga canimorsus]